MRRKVVKALGAIVALFAIANLGSYVYLRQSLPDIDGSIEVPGLTAPVDIVRDADAVPHVIAANRLDALFGLGYVHAQDRLWQMELQRRIGHGRLAEILGAAAIPQDRFLRTVGFGRAARTAWEHMSGEAREQVNAYISGINAFLAAHHGGELPPEFTLLRFEPEPWTGADVVVWVKMMAWDLSANYSFELLRHDLVRAVGIERMQQLMPAYPQEGLSIVSSNRPAAVAQTLQPPYAGPAEGPPDNQQGNRSWSAALTASLSQGDPFVRDFLLGGAKTEGIGSNNWVVDGTLTSSGKPLLANDPHLSARMPSTWYLAHVSGGDYDVIGATLPGTPTVALGRNRFIAWGATNVAADVQDLYRERLDPTGRFAEFRGTMEALTIVPETIIVKGGTPVHLDVRLSRHGPLVSDAINANNADMPEPAGSGLPRRPKAPPYEPLAFRWTALDADDPTLASFLKLNGAKNWADFTAALRDFVTPSQNFVYADVGGHIGYYAPGRIPIRAKGDGSLPAEGWTGDAEWTGWVPFDELPHVADPPEHFIVTANNRPAGAPYPHMLGLEWAEPYRAQRIVDLLKQQASFTPQDFAHIQADTLSLHAKALLPILMRHAHPDTAPDRQAFELLRQWSFDASAESAATAIFQAWFLQLAPTLVGDELGPTVLDDYQGRFSYVTRFVTAALSQGDSAWCDDVTTKRVETCDEEITKALSSGVADLTRRLGANMSGWRWDGVHQAVFPHQGLDAVGMMRPWLSRSVANGGDWSTINVGPVSASQRYQQRSVAGYREIIDLSPANDSRFLDAVGQSGHPMSQYYDDFLPDWRNVKHRRMRMERADIDRAALGRLRLTPQ